MHWDQDKWSPALRSIRHELHCFPELSGKEFETAARIAAFLREHVPQAALVKLGSTGLAAVFTSDVPGKTILLRCELDALPISESLNLEHRSRHAGVAHKCGHDGHMASMLGVATALAVSPPPAGRVVLLFQPAEESGEGARWILADPRFSELAPDLVFGFHNLPRYEFGTIVWRRGTFASASIGMIIRLLGATTHSSYPEHGRSPAPALAQLMQRLPGICQDESKEQGSMLTVTQARLGTFEGRADFGVAPGEAELRCVLRSHTTSDLAELRQAAEKLVTEIAGRHELGITVTWDEEFPATVSHDDAITLLTRAAAASGLRAQELQEPMRWSEDFGYYLDECPGAFFGLGSGHSQPQLHHPDYDYPDALIPEGIKIYCSILEEVWGTC
jgi:amidohydrolase